MGLNFWESESAAFFSERNKRRLHKLHSKIATLIDDSSPERLLDYGCGKGDLVRYLDPTDGRQISLYDINEDRLIEAEENLDKYEVELIFDSEEIEEGQYDTIVLSMVLMCIEYRNEYRQLIKDLESYLSRCGNLIVSITHPCFLNKSFYGYENDFTKGNKKIDYFEEGMPYNVYMMDEDDMTFKFTDYFWSLSFTLNKFSEEELVLERMLEIPDIESHDDVANSRFPPYLIIEFVKP